MTATAIPTMIVDDIEPRSGPGFHVNPVDCDHLWEPHLWEIGRAYCARCGSCARWVNDPRAEESL